MRSCCFNQQVVGGPCEALEIMPDGDVRILSDGELCCVCPAWLQRLVTDLRISDNPLD